MSLSAHTNQPGEYYTYKPYSGIYTHSYTDGTSYTSSFEDWYTYQISYRTHNVKSDGVHPTPFSRYVARITDFEKSTSDYLNYYSDGTWQRTHTEWYAHLTALEHTPYANVLAGPRDNAEAAAKTKCLNKLGDQKAQLGADLAQAKQTFGLLAGASLNLAKALRDFKRGNWGSIPSRFGLTRSQFRSGKFIGDKWLEFQFAWKPTYQSIHDYTELLHAITSKQLLLSAHSTMDWSGERTLYKGAIKHSVKASGRQRYGIVASIKNPNVHSLVQGGLANPLSIAWELVPYSFVVDWFMPVGNVLDAFTATLGLQWEHGYWTRTENQEIKEIFETPWDTNMKHGGRTSQHFWFDRSPLGGFPMPSLYAKANPFSFTHATEALALIRQLIR